jgi:hypothetical protein
MVLGYWGVGYAAEEVIAASEGVVLPSLIDNLYAQGIINRRAFSLYLDDQEAGTGSILFGGVDPDKYTGDLVALAITPNSTGQYDRYAVTWSAVTFNSPSGKTTLSPAGMASRVTLDSGSTLSYFPKAIGDEIISGLGAVYVAGADGYFVPCADRQSTASLDFTFGGSNGPTINVPMNQLIGDYFEGDTFGNGVPACQLNIAIESELQSEEVDTLILGDSFMRSAYLVYDLDKNEVAIAQAKFNSTSSNIKAIPSGSAAIPGVSSTATKTASQYAFPSSLLTQTAASTGLPRSAGAGTAILTLPSTASAGVFSLRVSTATSASSGAAATSTSAASTHVMHTGSLRMAGVVVSMMAAAVLGWMSVL